MSCLTGFSPHSQENPEWLNEKRLKMRQDFIHAGVYKVLSEESIHE